MSLKKIIKAALKTRNLLVIAILLFVSAIFSFYFPYVILSLAVYILLVVQTLGSKKFNEEFQYSDELEEIYKLSRENDSLYKQVSRKIDKNLRNKAIRIIKQKDELMKYFLENRHDPLKQRIVRQAFKLVAAYLHLIYSYSMRNSEISPMKMNDLLARINYNNRKLGTLKNYEAVLELTKTIEMDEKLLSKMKEEREELEMVSVKLDQIESTIGAFKHRIMASDMSDSMSEKIEDIINEAAALDTVLTERSRNKLKL